jgi:hypothetical protein
MRQLLMMQLPCLKIAHLRRVFAPKCDVQSAIHILAMSFQEKATTYQQISAGASTQSPYI